jgi:hypothetical protein
VSTTVIKRFTFDTDDPTPWVLTGDCEIGKGGISDVVTLADPVTQLPWATAWVSSFGTPIVPPLDENGDALLTRSYFARATTGPCTLVWTMARKASSADSTFIAQVRESATGTSYTYLAFEYAVATGSILYTLVVSATGGVDESVHDTVFAGAFPLNTWRTVRLSSEDGTSGVAVGGWLDADYPTSMVQTNGRCMLYADNVFFGETWRVGGGGASPHAQPYIAVPKSGTVKLDSVYAYTLPLTTTALGTINALHDFVYDPSGLNYKQVALSYNLYHNGAWSGWTAAPSDGDLSAVAVDGGDLILVGASMDNTADHPTRPALIAIDLTITCQSVAEAKSMREVLNAIKAAIDADATVAAITGWDATGCVICTNDAIGQIPLQAQAGCYVARGSTIPEPQGTGKSATIEVTPAMIWHEVEVCPAVQFPTPDPSDVLIGDEGLEELTEAVWAALKTTNLSGAIKWLELGAVDPMELKASGDNLYVRANRIRVRVQAGIEVL